MRLGIVASHESAAPQVEGLAAAAARRGWACRCFLTDSGVRLATSPALVALAASGAIRLDVCEHSWHHFSEGPAPQAARLGTQFSNAELVRECDRVIVVPGRT
ncbi:MAG: hypothetical protein IPL06_03985 [Betaproteobacteria bacterium]|nr:hypothetical protein [Betaproteobacteria bacterium]